MIKVISINKEGNKVIDYTCDNNGNLIDLTKEMLVNQIRANNVTNAKIQIYKEQVIIRTKDDVVVKVGGSTVERQTRQTSSNIGNLIKREKTEQIKEYTEQEAEEQNKRDEEAYQKSLEKGNKFKSTLIENINKGDARFPKDLLQDIRETMLGHHFHMAQDYILYAGNNNIYKIDGKGTQVLVKCESAKIVDITSEKIDITQLIEEEKIIITRKSQYNHDGVLRRRENTQTYKRN